MEEGNVNVTRGFRVSGMPMSNWMRWEQDALDNFGNCYWLKIWSDHEKVKQSEVLINQLMRKIEEHDQLFDEMMVANVKEEKKVSTLGE
jgi:hypothetical protein